MPLLRLSTSGNLIVDERGRRVILRGANVMHSEWIGASTWEARALPVFASEWHGNVLVRGFASEPVLCNDANYLRLLDELTTLAEAHGVYVVFSWRSFEINGPQPCRPDDRAAQALAALAARYRDCPHVMYALQVEPHSQLGRAVRWRDLRPLFERMVDGIRAAAAPFEPVVMVPGVDWSRDVSGAMIDPVARSNVVYKSHPYNASRDFQRLFGDTHDAGLPVFIGEFAPATSSEHTCMTLGDVRDLLAYARGRGIGWAAWLLDYQTHALMHEHDLTPTPYGALVRDAMCGVRL